MKESIDCFKHDHPLYKDLCCNNIKIDEENPLVCPICFRDVLVPTMFWSKENADRWQRYIEKDAELKQVIIE